MCVFTYIHPIGSMCVRANVCRLDKEANCAAAYSPNCEQTAEAQQLTLKNETPKALKLKKAGGGGGGK